MLVRPHHRPRLPDCLVTTCAQLAQGLLPGAISYPAAAVPVIDGLPVPEPLRQIPSRASGPGPVEDPVESSTGDYSTGAPATDEQTATAPVPRLRITEAMPLQSVIINHDVIQAETTTMIYASRPSPAVARHALTAHRRKPSLAALSSDADPLPFA
jgi:hypothetical protein